MVTREKPTPFNIYIANSVLNRFRHRLTNLRWPNFIPGAFWHYGAEPDYHNAVHFHEACDRYTEGSP